MVMIISFHSIPLIVSIVYNRYMINTCHSIILSVFRESKRTKGRDEICIWLAKERSIECKCFNAAMIWLKSTISNSIRLYLNLIPYRKKRMISNVLWNTKIGNGLYLLFNRGKMISLSLVMTFSDIYIYIYLFIYMLILSQYSVRSMKLLGKWNWWTRRGNIFPQWFPSLISSTT